MACLFFPLLLWHRLRKKEVWTARDYWLLAGAGALLAAAFVSKEPTVLLGAPIAVDLLWRRRWKGLVALAAAVRPRPGAPPGRPVADDRDLEPLPRRAAPLLRERLPDRELEGPLAGLPRHELRLLVRPRRRDQRPDVPAQPGVLPGRPPHRPPALLPLRALRPRPLPGRAEGPLAPPAAARPWRATASCS